MLFEILTGSLPFQGESLTAKLTAILTHPVPDLAQIDSSIPDALADLVYRMLLKDPQQRIPSVRLVGAELEAILKGWETLPARSTPAKSRFETPTPAAQKAKHNLPPQPTSFVGRQAELTELARLLADPEVRLLTILGAGGMGKTRLALEAGAAQLDNVCTKCQFTNGVYFVALTPLEKAEAIVPTIAAALGFSFYEGGEPLQQLLGYLCEKSLLLILDNFEHLLSGVDLVSEVLKTAPHVKILATSRARLDVQGEQLFHLSGMDVPDWDKPENALEYSAVKLFLQSAHRVHPGFELTPENLKFVARICRLVGGMPLGILLAAAWVEMLTAQEIAEEMQRSLDFLATEQQGIPERQRSMRGVFDYSWDSLTEGERQAFCAISVFRGGFTREAALEVTQASLRELMGLVNKSLLHRTPTGRYEIHELLRQYGAEKLAETLKQEQVQNRHCAYYAEFVHKRETYLIGKNQRAVLSEIEAEIDNVRVGWEWAVTHAQVRRIDDYLESVGELYRTRGWYQEGANLFARAAQDLSRVLENVFDSEIQLVHGKVLLREGRFCDSLGIVEKANQLLRASLQVFRGLSARKEAAYTLCYLGGCGSLYGGLEIYKGQERELCEEGLSIFKEIGDQRGIALALKGLAWITLHHGSYLMAKKLFHESLEFSREVGDQEGITTSLSGLGYTCWILGEYRQAQQLHEEMLALSMEIGDQGAMARSLGDLGIDACGLQDFEKSRQLWMDSLTIYREIGNPWGMSDELGDLGEIANAMGEYGQAFQFAQESLAIYNEIINRPRPWSLRVLGNAELGLGKVPEARVHLHQALELAWTQRRLGYVLITLVGIAALLAAEGENVLAAELLTLVLHHPASWQWAKDRAGPLFAELEAELTPDVMTVAQERGRTRDLETTVEELLSILGE